MVKNPVRNILSFYNKITKPIDRFFLGVKNSIFWLPIIWMDRDWDNYYLLKVVEIKIRRMRKFFIEKGVAVHTKKELRNMLIAANVLSRLRKDEYGDYLHDKLDMKWGELRLKEIEQGKGWVRTELIRDNVKTEKDRDQVHKEVKQIIEHEGSMYKQDLDILAKKIRHIREWWD